MMAWKAGLVPKYGSRGIRVRHTHRVFVKGVLNGVMLELRFKYNGVRMELQGSRLGFDVCVVPSSVKLGVLEFTEVRVGSELDQN